MQCKMREKGIIIKKKKKASQNARSKHISTTEITGRQGTLHKLNPNDCRRFDLSQCRPRAMAPVWDCFARLDPVIHALSPSFLCYPTRPHDDLEGGVFQDAPNFCCFRPPPPSSVVHFHVPHGKSYRSSWNSVGGVGQELNPMTPGG